MEKLACPDITDWSVESRLLAEAAQIKRFAIDQKYLRISKLPETDRTVASNFRLELAKECSTPSFPQLHRGKDGVAGCSDLESIINPRDVTARGHGLEAVGIGIDQRTRQVV